MIRLIRRARNVCGVWAAVAGLAVAAAGVQAAAEVAEVSLAPVRPNQSLTMEAMIGFVNAQPVFVRDILLSKDAELRGLAHNSRNVSEFRESARAVIKTRTDEITYNLMALTAAQSALSDDDAKRIDFYVSAQRAKLISEHGGSMALADQELRAMGTSVDKQVDALRKQLTVEFYRAKYIEPKTDVTGQMIRAEYERHKADWEVGAEIDLYTLSLPVSRWLREPGQDGRVGPVIEHPTPAQVQQAEVQAMALAKAIAAKAKAGADWAQLVEDNRSADDKINNGGHWGKVRKGSLANKEVEGYAFSIPAESVGDPQLVRLSNPLQSYVIIGRVGKKTEARTIPFAEAQRAIKEKLLMRRRMELQREFIERMSNGAAIEAIDRMTDIAVDVAVSLYVTQ